MLHTYLLSYQSLKSSKYALQLWLVQFGTGLSCKVATIVWYILSWNNQAEQDEFLNVVIVS